VHPVGDINGDCIVNQADSNILSSDMGSTNPRSDLDHNGIVNNSDQAILQSHLGQTCT
jgi:hypothetical protein